ncbi:MAG: hypothetical protein OHK0022_27750 [Roseiflexaceae bacterium]
MWEIVQVLLYAFLGLMFLSTFVSAQTRARARRGLGHLWTLAAPYAYKLVTGRVPADLPRAQLKLERGERSAEGSAGAQRSERSPQLNAEKQGSTSSETNAAQALDRLLQEPVGERDPGLPATLDELRTLAHILILYGRKPNKSEAIQLATGATKGGSPAYQRWSDLFDRAVPADGAARAAAKATTSSKPGSTPSANSTPGAPVRNAAPARAATAAEPAT